MQFRFTFYNDSLAPSGLVVAQPEGWKDAKLVLERHKDYGSLIEYFEGDFIWYGSAMTFIRQCEDAQGPDAVIRLVIDLSITYGKWETPSLFDGRVDVSSLEEMSKGRFRYKMKVPIIRNNTWAKFINRKSIPVDVLSTTDLDGNTRAVVDKFTLPLPSQTIRSTFSGRIIDTLIELRSDTGFNQFNEYNDPVSPYPGTPVPDFTEVDPYSNIDDDYKVQISPNQNDIEDLKDSFTIPIKLAEPNDTIGNFLQAKYNGSYTIDIRIELSIFSSLFASNDFQADEEDAEAEVQEHFEYSYDYFDLYLKINGTDYILTKTNSSIIVDKRSTTYTLILSVDLLVGDQISCYALFLNADLENAQPNNPYAVTTFWENSINYLHFWGSSNINYITKFVYSNVFFAPGFGYKINGTALALPFEYDGEEAPSGEENPSYITIVGNTTFEDTTTDAFHLQDAAENIISKLIGVDDAVVSDAMDGCKGKYAVNKCLHWRGYAIEDKPLFMSFDQWWNIAHPILCFGLAEDGDQIRIEGLEYFYNPTVIVNLPNVPDIIRTWDKEMFVKSVEVGYQKWSAESESGIDDPQTKRTYRTKFTALGKDEKQLSIAIAASLALEQTRRNRVEFSKDWRLDEEFAIVAIKDDNTVELGVDFESITNLLNSDTRYNVRITAARNFTRWLKWYNGCMQHTTGEKFYFTGGEGNFDMVSEMTGTDCELSSNVTLSEKQDIDVTSDYLVLPRRYQFRYPLTPSQYTEIKDNRHNAIGLSRTSSDFTPHHIDKLEYYPVKGYAQFTVNLAFPGDATLPPGGGQFRLLEDGTVRELEDGTKRIID